MINRALWDLLRIVVLYAVYWVIVYMLILYNVLITIGVFPPAEMSVDEFLLQFRTWASLVVLISFLATLAWYVIAQWGMKPHTTKYSTWLWFWLAGLALTLLGGLAAFQLGPIPSESPEYLAAFYLLSGALAYYLATLFFSPTSVKFVVPLSKLIRR